MKTRLQDPSLGMTGISIPKPESKADTPQLKRYGNNMSRRGAAGSFIILLTHHKFPGPASIVVALTFLAVNIVTLFLTILFEMGFFASYSSTYATHSSL